MILQKTTLVKLLNKKIKLLKIDNSIPPWGELTGQITELNENKVGDKYFVIVPDKNSIEERLYAQHKNGINIIYQPANDDRQIDIVLEIVS